MNFCGGNVCNLICSFEQLQIASGNGPGLTGMSATLKFFCNLGMCSPH